MPMILAILFLGVVTGAAATLLFAMWYAAKPAQKVQKSAPKVQHGVSAIGVDLTGRTDMESANELFLKASIRQASDERLWEIDFLTRH
jgi:hypothetical protein